MRYQRESLSRALDVVAVRPDQVDPDRTRLVRTSADVMRELSRMIAAMLARKCGFVIGLRE